MVDTEEVNQDGEMLRHLVTQHLHEDEHGDEDDKKDKEDDEHGDGDRHQLSQHLDQDDVDGEHGIE